MKKHLILSLLFVWYFQAYSQTNDYDVIPSSGSYFTSTDYSISWTLGESVTETFHSTEIILTQGFQQSMFLITSLDEFTDEGFSVKVYPNPFTDLINILAISNTGLYKAIRIEVYDAQGKILLINKFNSNHMQINMSAFSGSVYFLKVINTENTIHRNFKIHKVN